MRFTPAALATVLIATTFSASSVVTRAEIAPINALSLSMQAEAERLSAAGDLDGAIGYFEAALVSDPRNANAYIGLGGIARAQNLPGKAISFYRDALALLPDSRAALLGQGQAMVQRGAVERARASLARLQTVCGDRDCPEIAELTSAINGASGRTALRPQDVIPQPIVEPAPAVN